MKITGLDEITKSLSDLEKALGELDGNLASVQFDADDPESIEQAIQSAHRAIDEKVNLYARNEMVLSLVSDLKENVRTSILERAAEARLQESEDE